MDVTCPEARQKILPDGTCETCADYTAPLYDETTESWSCVACGGKTIGEDEIVEVDGSCCNCNVEEGEPGSCKDGTYGFGYLADANNRVCTVCTPKDNEILTPEGECIACESYTAPNTQQRECVGCGGKVPGEFEKILPNGSCETCPVNEICGQMIPGPLQHTCYCSDCPDDNYYMSMPEKVCLECEEYFHASEDGLNCTRCGKDDTSPTEFEIIDENGFCITCPAGEYPAPILDNCDAAAGEICFATQCKKDTCDPTLYKIFNTHGQLIVDCPANTFVNDDCSACITECDPMPANHIWDVENRGYCNQCDDYMVPNADNTECVIWGGCPDMTTKWFQGETGPICKDCPAEFEQCPDNQYMCCRT